MGTIHPIPQEAVTAAVGAVTSYWAPIFLETGCEHQHDREALTLLQCRNVEEQRLTVLEKELIAVFISQCK